MKEAIEEYAHPDGTLCVIIFRHSSGFWSFNEESLESNTNWGTGKEYNYWLPVLESGLYASLDEARADAFSTLGWLELVQKT